MAWKLKKNTAGEMVWEEEGVPDGHPQNVRLKRLRKDYYILYYGYKDLAFTDKKQAIIFAKDWMKQNPHGVYEY